LKKTPFRFVSTLTREQCVSYLKNGMYPDATISEDDASDLIDIVALNCPDPCAALDVFFEEKSSIEEIIDQAMALSPRDPNSYSEDELHPNHPLRIWKMLPE
jgi:hypothetical protein